MSQTSTHSKPRGPLRRFFSGLGRLATWLRITLSNIIFFVLLVIIVLALIPEKPLQLPEEFALRLAPQGMLVDEYSYVDPMNMLLQGTENQQPETRVRDLVKAIDSAGQDARVTALVMELDELEGGGISKLEEIGAALKRFKATEKPLLAVGNNFSQTQYYLASYADEIALHDMGMVLITGFERYQHYFKQALDKLAVNVHVFRAGKYKDFVEPFTRTNMSDESREHIGQWLNQLWGVYASRVEELRGLPSGALNDHINSLGQDLKETEGDSAQLALDSGLVDHLMGHRERTQYLIERFGKHPQVAGYKGVNQSAYLADLSLRERQEPNKIALLVASGTILEGHHPEGTIGSQTILEQLEQVRQDDNIKALVVRIDSGGGSAFASEVIRSELAALRDSGLPVFISMGSVAASGGYWMAAGADQIWATPTTLTGSIGVFGIIPTFEDSLDKLGINTDGLGTTQLAGAGRIDRPLDPAAKQFIQRNVDNIYQRFIKLVAEARNMDPAEVDRVAQGRVWSAATARELGLVDQLGYLNDVIHAAAGQAKLENYTVQLIERQRSPFEQLVRQLQRNQVAAFLPEGLAMGWWSTDLERQLSPLVRPLKAFTEMNDPNSIYARCLECLAP